MADPILCGQANNIFTMCKVLVATVEVVHIFMPSVVRYIYTGIQLFEFYFIQTAIIRDLTKHINPNQ